LVHQKLLLHAFFHSTLLFLFLVLKEAFVLLGFHAVEVLLHHNLSLGDSLNHLIVIPAADRVVIAASVNVLPCKRNTTNTILVAGQLVQQNHVWVTPHLYGFVVAQ